MKNNETSPAHTPVPYGVFVNPAGDLYLAQVNASGAQVKHICVLTGDDKPRENEATAEFIVRACNNHDSLIDACERLLNCPDLNTDDLDVLSVKAIENARTILSTANAHAA